MQDASCIGKREKYSRGDIDSLYLQQEDGFQSNGPLCTPSPAALKNKRLIRKLTRLFLDYSYEGHRRCCATQGSNNLSGTENSILCLASDLRVSRIGDLWVEVSSAVQRHNPRIEVCAMKAIESSRESESSALMTVIACRPLVNCDPNAANRPKTRELGHQSRVK